MPAKPKNPYGPKICCTLCGNLLLARYLGQHYRRMHLDHCESESGRDFESHSEAHGCIRETQTKKHFKMRQRKTKVCPFCKRAFVDSNLRRHIRSKHPTQANEYVTLAREADNFEEADPTKRSKTVEDTQDTAADTDDNSTSTSQCSLKCACGIYFKSKIYFEVHETIFHRSFSTLKRCEHPGCFGLFLCEELHNLHKEATHTKSG
mmetsp:Transcript_29210/g.52189  ORF Transcript_29210/g.52189 Transcript_29210/m.52189 type:complete len:206 (-) Transcript_29210:24-641(-)